MNKEEYIKKIRREATSEEIALIKKKYPQKKSVEFLTDKQLVLVFVLLGLAIMILSSYQLLEGVPWRPEFKARSNGGIIGGFLMILISPMIIYWPTSWRRKPSPPMVSEQRIKPTRVIEIVQDQERFVLMEVQKNEWLKLDANEFANLNKKSISRQEVVLISLSPSRPLTCYGYGKNVPFVQKEEQKHFRWSYLRDGEIQTILRLDSWFDESTSV